MRRRRTVGGGVAAPDSASSPSSSAGAARSEGEPSGDANGPKWLLAADAGGGSMASASFAASLSSTVSLAIPTTHRRRGCGARSPR